MVLNFPTRPILMRWFSSFHQDEDVYTFFEPELPFDVTSITRNKPTDGPRLPAERRAALKLPASKSVAKSSQTKTQRPFPAPDRRTSNNKNSCGSLRRPSPEKISWSVLDLKGDNYFSCAVGRARTSARYLLSSSDDVVSFLNILANASSSCELFSGLHV